MEKTKSIRLRGYIFFIVLFCTIWCTKCNAKAATIRVLSVNGMESPFLSSASMFYDCIDDFYINGIKVKKDDCFYSNNPSYDSLDNAIKSVFAGATDNDISMFYYAGHGAISSNGRAGIYTKDQYIYGFSNLYNELKMVRGKKIIILDCCYSGSFITQNFIDKTKFTVLTACEYNSYSPFLDKFTAQSILEGRKVNITHFCDKILKGLGYYKSILNADYDKNNIVTINELYKYLQKNYQRVYRATHDGKEIIFKAIPQKYGNVNFSFSKKATQLTDKITLNKTSVSLYISENIKLKATVVGKNKKVIWKSSKPSVATVDSSGKIKAKKVGTTTITATANGKTAKCKVTIKKPTIKLNKSRVTIYTTGTKTATLKVTIKGKNSKVIWKSSNTSVATVTSKGKVTAKRAGVATISAKANGVTAKCKVTVRKGDPATIAYKQYLRRNLKNRYYAIVNAGQKKKPILIVAYAGFRPVSKYDGYGISVYAYRNGRVQKIIDYIPQSEAAGPWYYYKNKLYTTGRRGGYYRLDIAGNTYRRPFFRGYNRTIFRDANIVKIKKNR